MCEKEKGERRERGGKRVLRGGGRGLMGLMGKDVRGLAEKGIGRSFAEEGRR